MKFLCDSCKAKYQIPDEKVAGRTVRMKCRKCGHLVVIDGSVAGVVADTGAHRAVEPHEAAVAADAPAKGLAGAFSALAEAPAVAIEPSPSAQWYAGLGGAPVGPMSEAELGAKMGAGEIARATLVWRDGMAEWVALETVPALVAMLDAITAAAARAAAPPAAAPAPSVAPPPAAAAPSAPPPAAAAPSAPASAAPVAAPSAPPPAASPSAPPSSGIEAGIGAAIAPVTMAPSVMPVAHPHHRRGLPAAGIVVIGLACGLVGMVAAVALMNGKAAPEPPPAVVATAATAAPAPTATESAAPATVAAPAASVAEIGGVAIAAAKGGGGGASPKGGTPPDPKGSPSAAPTVGLASLTSLTGGPTVAPTATAKAGGGGAPLSAGDVERTVQANRALVSRQCWEPALNAKSANAPRSARVVASVSVAADGRVTSVSASGGDAFPGLASCVQGRVRNWRFPPSDVGGDINVPFVFAAQ